MTFAETIDAITYDTICELEMLEVRAQRGFRDIHKREETLVNSLRWQVDLRAVAYAALVAWIASR
jgi:hypothetical protein